jgi:hypothetical protein
VIAARGHGRFSQRQNGLIFSGSDDTDAKLKPRTSLCNAVRMRLSATRCRAVVGSASR